MEIEMDVLYLNATQTGSLTEENLRVMNSFIDACRELEIFSKIATDNLGVQAMRNRKRRGHNVLIVDFLAITKGKMKLDSSFRQLYQLLGSKTHSGYMPLYVLCGSRDELTVAKKALGSVARGIFLSSSEIVMTSICEELRELFFED